ncbi:MAG: MoaD family protein [Candidatus Methanomethylicaceae archaeon]
MNSKPLVGVSTTPEIKLRYLAVLKGLSDDPFRGISFEGDSLKDLLEHLRKVEPPQLKSRLFEEGGHIRPDILVFINFTEASVLGGLNAKIKDGDEVTILPSVHGG